MIFIVMKSWKKCHNPCSLKSLALSSKLDKRLYLTAKLKDMVTGLEQLQNLRHIMKPEWKIKMMTSSIVKFSLQNDYFCFYQFRRDKDTLYLNLQNLCKVLRFFKSCFKGFGV